MRRVLAWASIIGASFFLVAAVALHILAPEVDPMRYGLSFYAHSRFGFLIDLAIVLMGVSAITLALALWPAKPSTAGRLGLLLLMAFGVTEFVAGFFPVDAPGASPSLAGSIHSIAGYNFLLVVAAVLLVEKSRSTDGDPGHPRPITVLFAWLFLASTVLLFTFNGPLVALGIGGAIQRVFFVVLIAWILLKAMPLVRTEAPNLAA